MSVTGGEGEERVSENESDGRREESVRPSCDDVDDKRAIQDWQGGGDCSVLTQRSGKGVMQLRGS